VVCDLGCGPGHVAQYLNQRGANVIGIDISPRMVEQARLRYPGLRFEVGDMRSLTQPNGAFAAVVAMYSLIHFDDSDLGAAVGEICRVLRPSGVLLASFHRGDESRHVEELFGCHVELDFRFFEPEQITGMLAGASLEIEHMIEREPYPEVEVETQRFYVIARTGPTGRDARGAMKPRPPEAIRGEAPR
jgi:SAM-dependent methyltransferase